MDKISKMKSSNFVICVNILLDFIQDYSPLKKPQKLSLKNIEIKFKMKNGTLENFGVDQLFTRRRGDHLVFPPSKLFKFLKIPKLPFMRKSSKLMIIISTLTYINACYIKMLLIRFYLNYEHSNRG